MDAAEKSARGRQLHFLWRVEPALRRAAFLDDGDGFLARSPNWQSERSAREEALAGGQRLHESEHARVFQIREFSAPKFPVVGRARRHHLSATPSRHSPSGRNFVLHVSFAFLYARHLSRRFATDPIAP